MRFARYSLVTLAWNVAVILWGAYVRASGSGAGCGNDWPACRGQVVPRAPELKTIVEFTHRATSGLALVSVVVLLVAAFRAFPRGHAVRRGAASAMFFMLTEAAVGALLVKFELVAGNATLGRALFMAVHLLNTFLLLGSLALTSFWAHGGAAPRFRGQGGLGVMAVGSVAGLLVLGVSGAIAALGDTLFPAVNLIEGMKSDFAPTAHLFVRLRVWHPVLALVVGGGVVFSAVFLAQARSTPAVRRAAVVLGGAVLGQLGLGVLNMVLLAPVSLQLLHLLVADVVWMSLVILAAAALGAPALAREPASAPAAA